MNRTVTRLEGRARLRVAGVAALAAVGLFAAACSSGSSNAPAAKGSAGAGAPAASAATPLSVTLALIPPKMLFLGFYAAQDEGFFAKYHLNVKLMPELGGVQAQRVVAAGDAVIVAGGTDGFAALAAQGQPVEAIWNFSKSDFSLIADNSITSVSQLRGKTIGVGDATGPAYELTAIALRAAGVPVSSVHFVVLAGRPALAGALVSGEIQASVFHVDDGYAVLRADSKVHVLQPLFQTAPEYWLSGVSVSKLYARAHPKTLVDFLAAMLQAQRWLYTHRSQAIALGVSVTGESEPVVTQSYDFFVQHTMWSRNADLTDAEIQYTFAQFKANGIISHIPPVSQMYDPSFVNQALRMVGSAS